MKFTGKRKAARATKEQKESKQIDAYADLSTLSPAASVETRHLPSLHEKKPFSDSWIRWFQRKSAYCTYIGLNYIRQRPIVSIGDVSVSLQLFEEKCQLAAWNRCSWAQTRWARGYAWVVQVEGALKMDQVPKKMIQIWYKIAREA